MIPIGGNFRHMIAYQKLAISNRFKASQILLPDDGQIVEFFPNQKVKISQKIETRDVLVDALGVGDVGNVVLRDRKILASEGMVIAVIPLDQNNYALQGEPEIATRGFIYVKENMNFLHQTKERIRLAIKKTKGREMDKRFVRQKIQEELEKFFFKTTGRRPMVLPIIIEV